MLLAAGLGTRLRPLTYELPKPMVPILGRPVMEHIMRLLARHDFGDVVANLHYFPDLIRDYFGDGSQQGIKLVYSYEEELLGTAGGVRNVRDHFGDETFLIISGDALTDIDLTAFYKRHKEADSVATLALKRVDDPSQLGVVIVDDKGRIQGFQEKPAPGEELSNLGSCGIYMFEPAIFDYFPEKEFVDWAQDVFPVLLDQGVGFFGHEIGEYWNDVGSLEEYRQGNFDALEGLVEVEMPGGRNGCNAARRRRGRGLRVHRRGLRDRLGRTAHRPGRDRRALPHRRELRAARHDRVAPHRGRPRHGAGRRPRGRAPAG